MVSSFERGISMTVQILIEGEGLLADYVQQLLAEHFTIMRQNSLTQTPREAELALVLHAAWDPSIHQNAEKTFRDYRIPWLRGYVAFGEGIIGPLVLPEQQGCSSCADLRMIVAGMDRQEAWSIHNRLSRNGGIKQDDAWATRTGLSHMAFLIVKEVKKFLLGEQTDLNRKIVLTNLRTLTTSFHLFLPDPLCPVCSSLPDDTSELAKIKIVSTPKVNGNSFRSRSIDELKQVLPKDYLDIRTGILNGKLQDLRLPFADIVVNMPMLFGDEGTAGRSVNYDVSELTAILEGLERNCGFEPRGKKRIIRDSYDHLKNIALNPERVGLHEKQQYEKTDFPFKPFRSNAPMNWVWGYSLLYERPILVPELLAYYSLGGGEGFIYETSNGCAIGGSLEEAIFHGILEVVERDSFLLTWYAKLPLPRLDLNTAKDKELLLMAERVRETAGYDLYFFNSTMEHGIPSVWGIAKNRNSKGLNLICAAGANPDPVSAVKSVIYELAGMMHLHDEQLEENREKYARMLTRPYEVKMMEDHCLLYGLPEAEERLEFLLSDNRPARSFEEEFNPQLENTDLKDDLENLLQRFHKLNLEVIVIDQSTPLTKRNGLYCVKVLIPGMLPMTFGHHLRRVNGLSRVLDIPMQLGFTKAALTYEQLNQHPHPFP